MSFELAKIPAPTSYAERGSHAHEHEMHRDALILSTTSRDHYRVAHECHQGEGSGAATDSSREALAGPSLSSGRGCIWQLLYLSYHGDGAWLSRV